MVLVLDFDIPKNIEQCRAKLREEFKKHADVKDVRVIDMLVIKVITIKWKLNQHFSFEYVIGLCRLFYV